MDMAMVWMRWSKKLEQRESCSDRLLAGRKYYEAGYDIDTSVSTGIFGLSHMAGFINALANDVRVLKAGVFQLKQCESCWREIPETGLHRSMERWMCNDCMGLKRKNGGSFIREVE